MKFQDWLDILKVDKIKERDPDYDSYVYIVGEDDLLSAYEAGRAAKAQEILEALTRERFAKP